jgi:hypothetical protein
MMPAALIYALMTDEEREAHNRAEARHRLVRLLTQEPVREERPARRVDRLARFRPARLLGYRSMTRPDAGGAPCRP